MAEDLYFSAKEAAAALEVSVPTLYCYVSRGFVRTHRTPGERASRYWRTDIEGFKRRRTLEGEALEAVIGGNSSITLRTETELFYRGLNAVELAETHSFEAVTAILWQRPEAELFGDNLPALPADYSTLREAFGNLGHVDLVVMLAPFMERANPNCFDFSPRAFCRASAAAIRWFASTVHQPFQITDRPIHLVLARTKREDDPLADILRRLLVLAADHEVDPTTLAVRALANTGVTPYRLIMTGLIASQGRRGTFGRMQSGARFLEEIWKSKNPDTVVLAYLRSGETLPGFGSKVYSDRDPRTLAMLRAFEERMAHVPSVKQFLRTVEIAKEATGLDPDFAVIFLVVSHLIGLNGREANILRLPRVAGWIAHSMEQFEEHALIRPHARYVGQLPIQNHAGELHRNTR